MYYCLNFYNAIETVCGFICTLGHESSVKAVYKHCTSPKTRRVARAIPQVPERILDAPEVVDDFCNNNNTTISRDQ